MFGGTAKQALMMQHSPISFLSCGSCSPALLTAPLYQSTPLPPVTHTHTHTHIDAPSNSPKVPAMDNNLITYSESDSVCVCVCVCVVKVRFRLDGLLKMRLLQYGYHNLFKYTILL